MTPPKGTIDIGPELAEALADSCVVVRELMGHVFGIDGDVVVIVRPVGVRTGGGTVTLAASTVVKANSPETVKAMLEAAYTTVLGRPPDAVG